MKVNKSSVHLQDAPCSWLTGNLESVMENLSSATVIEKAYAKRRSEHIIGSSPVLKSALVEVERVAPTDATVLVLGETGTGKELIARAIHDLSPRCACPFVKLDCAAIPFDLLERELFGHEKGAFTWAMAQKIGRFEMADTGTLFLDEIGDLPLALQPKLLRILQEQEFERPGSGRTHRVNVRLIAATHRDLADMVRQRAFRSDLYYRLNGFPVMLPPLRERRQDIPLLVSHFVEMFSQRMGKRIQHIPEETLSAFISHSWPGNVRELQNLIERAVILSNNGVLSNPSPVLCRNSITVTSLQGGFSASKQVTIDSSDQAVPNPLSISDRNSMTATSPLGTLTGSQQAAGRANNGMISDTSSKSNECSLTTARIFSHELGSSDPSSDRPIVFIVDDDASFRESMELLIRRTGWQAEPLACAREFLERPRSLIPNCLVLDVSLQDLDGLNLQKQISVERAETPIVFITGHGDVPTSVQAMKAGAIEFLIKPFSDEALLGAIREGLKRSSVALGREAEMRLLRNGYASLSHRERQVMALVVCGLLNKQVGAELGISEITVKAHRGRVMQKMGAKSVIDLVRMATRLRSERAFLASGQFRLPSPSPTSNSSARTMTVSSSSDETAPVAES
jgi:formate hydrogenlyase transcriptional activator